LRPRTLRSATTSRTASISQRPLQPRRTATTRFCWPKSPCSRVTSSTSTEVI
jgi:hypothetical protein